MKAMVRPAAWWRMLAGVMTALIAVSFVPVSDASAKDIDEPGPNAVKITEGYVIWGIKYSWRKYTGGTGKELSRGVELMEPVGDEEVGSYKWPIADGFYDPDTKTTVLNLDGQAHYLMYCEPDDPEMCALDSTFRDLQVVISPDEQVIYGSYIGRPQDNPGGPKELHEGVLAKLNIRSVDPVTENNKTLWNEIPSVAGDQLVIYSEETAIDPVTISYTGPSGKPYVPEKFVSENIPLYEKTHEWVAEGSEEEIFFPTNDGERLIVLHPPKLVGSADSFGPEADTVTLTALNAHTLTPVKSSTFNIADSPGNPRASWYYTVAFDNASNTLFFLSSREKVHLYAARWDEASEDFVLTEIEEFSEEPDDGWVFATGGCILHWDEEGNRLLMSYSERQENADPEHPDESIRLRMASYTPTSSGWTKTVHPFEVPEPQPRVDRKRAREALSSPRYFKESPIGWRNGHLVVATGNVSSGSTNEDPHGLPLIDVWEEADGSWKSRFIPDTHPAGTPEAAGADGNDMQSYNTIVNSVDGSVFAGEVVQAPTFAYFDDILGTPQRTEINPNSRTNVNKLAAATTDPALGYDFVVSLNLQTAYVLKNREIVSTIKLGRPFGRHFETGKPGTFYNAIQESEDAPPAIERYEITAMSPAVTQHPVSRQVDLVDGATTGLATFSVDYTAVGETTVQWQERPVGAEYFTDIEGANDVTLTVDADLAKDGTMYRAKLINPAGNVKSDDALLTVRSAPRFLDQPVDMSGGEGETVTFTAPVDPSIPADEQVWQMLVGDEWRDVTATEAITVDGDKLTVTVSEELDGSVFRSIIRNAVGQNVSDEAALTMVVPTEAPMVSEHPSSQQVEVGQSVTFTAAASGVPAPGVQWQERIGEGQWRDIDGATEPSLVIDEAELAQSGVEYRAVFTNEAGQAASEPATLTVLDPTPPPEPKPEPEPSEEPTVEPTIEPTEEPSAEPTMEPTVDPTREPNVDPSGEPSVMPSKDVTPDPQDPGSTVSDHPAKPTTDPSQHYGNDTMPHTGAVVWPLVLVAGGLIGLGGLLVLRRRYR